MACSRSFEAAQAAKILLCLSVKRHIPSPFVATSALNVWKNHDSAHYLFISLCQFDPFVF